MVKARHCDVLANEMKSKSCDVEGSGVILMPSAELTYKQHSQQSLKFNMK